MTTKVEKLRADADKARRLADEAEAEATREAQAEAERRAAAETKWYTDHADEYYGAPEVIEAARVEFCKAVRSGDLQAAFTAWVDWQRTTILQSWWAGFLYTKLFPKETWERTDRGGYVAPQLILRRVEQPGDFERDLHRSLSVMLKEDVKAYFAERGAERDAAVGG